MRNRKDLWKSVFRRKDVQNVYTAQGGEGMIAFASCFPGSIKAFEIAPGQEMILQKSAYLAGENGVELSAFFNKKIGAGLFGGEGFIMQKASGHGIMFAEFDGHVVEYELEAGEQIVVDTGHLAAMTASCTMEIKSVPGVKNMLFGGEGVFNTILTGPGKVWLQTMPISNVAGVLSPYFPIQPTHVELFLQRHSSLQLCFLEMDEATHGPSTNESKDSVRH